jgi:DNA polymerase III epsilon subunit-like protein
MNTNFFALSFDLETTGLCKWKDRFVQLGAALYYVDLETRQVEELTSFQEMCRSPVPMTTESARITGISQEMVNRQPLVAAQVLQHFQKWFLTALECPVCNNWSATKTENGFLKTMHEAGRCVVEAPRVLVSYNGHGFDLVFLTAEAARLSVGAVQYFREFKFTSFFDVMLAGKEGALDTTKLVRCSTGRCSYVLSDVYQVMVGKKLEGAHGALADSRAVMEVLKSCFECFLPWLKAVIICDKEQSGVFHLLSTVSSTLASCQKAAQQEQGRQDTGAKTNNNGGVLQQLRLAAEKRKREETGTKETGTKETGNKEIGSRITEKEQKV